MNWQKCGVLWQPQGEADWARTHATLPVVQVAAPDRWWIYVSTRDAEGKSRIGRLAVDTTIMPPKGMPTVRSFDPQPVLPLGDAGTFDDSGMMPAWLVHEGNNVWLYYIGWNVIGTVPYRLSIGLAVSEDGGVTFRRFSQGPIVDRNASEPFFATAPCVHKEKDLWRMWYVSCTRWENILGRWEPAYHVKYAESTNGTDWKLTGISCVDVGENIAVGRPCVFRRGDEYSMLYSYRSMTKYRSDPDHAYRLGYAESSDGILWQRKDDNVGIGRSSQGWDSQMLEYCWVQSHANETYLLYNGNGFGVSGIGMARLMPAVVDVSAGAHSPAAPVVAAVAAPGIWMGGVECP